MKSAKACFVSTLAVGVFALATGSAMGAGHYVIDPEQSTVIIKVKNRDVSFVYGRFNDISGTINVDRLSDPGKLDITVEIKSKSFDTNNKKRDRHVAGPEFLNAKKHPTINFKGRSVKKLEDGKFELQGKLTLLGVSKDLTVIFQQTGLVKISRTEYRLGGEVTFTIKRSEFGMDQMIPDVADEVTVIVNLEGICTLHPAG